MNKTFTKDDYLAINWFDDVIDHAPDVFNVIDENGVILHTNTKNFVEGKNLYIGSRIYDFFLPEFFENVKKTIARVFRTGEVDHYELATDFYGTPLRWYMTNLAPIVRGGDVVAVAMYIRDITDLKQTQQDLNQVNEELEKRVNERTRSLNEYARRLEASEKLNTELRSANNQLEVYEIVTLNALSAFEGSFGGIFTLSGDHLQLAICLQNQIFPPQTLYHDEDSLIYKFFISQKTQFLSVDSQQSMNCDFCKYIKSENAKSILLVPLKTKNELVGVLFLAFKYEKKFSPDEEQLVNVFIEASGNTLHRTSVMSELEQTLKSRENELNVLYEIMALASENEDIKVTFRSSLEKILTVVNFDRGIIQLLEDKQVKEEVTFQKTKGSKPLEIKDSMLTEILAGTTQDEKKRYKLTRASDGGHHYLSFPIRNKGELLGLLTLAGSKIEEDDLEHISLIISFADELGLVIENARQKKRSEEVLILEERQRLARDLHDSVSQALYGLVISADVGNKLLQLKEYRGLSETLKDIEESAIQSLREMRLMLFELRPLFFDTVGLIGALELRLNIVERRTGIETKMQAKGVEKIASPLDLEIYRIATEALNNSLKHSKAQQIQIDLKVVKNEVLMTICDDGIGFELGSNEKNGIGFSSMRERTVRIGGRLEVVSQKDKGTTITLRVPLKKIVNNRETL